jgi:hypothetical protein
MGWSRAFAITFVVTAVGCMRSVPIRAPTVLVIGGVRDAPFSATSGMEEETAAFRANDPVEVEWHGGWVPATVRRGRDGRWLVHYDGGSNDTDEWVSRERLRSPRPPGTPDEVFQGEDPDQPDP